MSEKDDRDLGPMDEKLRSSFENLRIEPSGKVWRGMNRKLLWLELIRFNFTNVPVFFRIAVPAMILIISGLAVYLAQDETDPAAIIVNNAPAQVSTPVTNPEPAAAITPETAVAKEPAGNESRNAQQETVPSLAISETGFQVEESADITVAEKSSSAANMPAVRPISESPAFIDPLGFTGFEYGIVPEIVMIDNPVPPNPDLNTGTMTMKGNLPHTLAIGANLSPDMVFYNTTSDYFKYTYSFDVSAQYGIGKFYIQGGLGLSYSSDIGNYDISYMKNDSTGYYYQVNSFYRDDHDPERIVFDLEQVTIFDSNQYYYQYNTENSYLYLQIPVTIGFRAVSLPRWSLSVEAGGIYSYLIWKDEPAPNFYAPDSRVNEITRIDPLRMTSNFAVTGGIRVDYHFSRGFDLMVEPDFKYYINAIQGVDGAKVDQPWSVGLKVGVWYRFDLKKR